jgi:hypothetical protein
MSAPISAMIAAAVSASTPGIVTSNACWGHLTVCAPEHARLDGP